MATVTVEEILLRAQTILQDATELRWPLHELLAWLNDAYREIILLRPDAHSQVEVLTCVQGTRQDLRREFPEALRLLDVVRTLPADGRTPSSGIRHVHRPMLDDIRPEWHSERPTHEVEHFAFDPRIPTQFLVYPPAATGAKIEVAFSSVPTGHALDEIDATYPCPPSTPCPPACEFAPENPTWSTGSATATGQVRVL